jgi:hypothetical protein
VPRGAAIFFADEAVRLTDARFHFDRFAVFRLFAAAFVNFINLIISPLSSFIKPGTNIANESGAAACD